MVLKLIFFKKTKLIRFCLDSQLQPIPIFIKTLNGNLAQLQVSLEDSIQVIMQSLAESSETCYVTSFHLEIDSQPIDEFTNLSEIPNLKPHITFQMVAGYNF